ncbi:MAG: MATE family efflux transporter [Bilophila wadsworthia]
MAHADPSSELATKPLGRLLLRFAIPSIFAQIVNLLYNIVDRIFVGRIPEIGPLALAGLGVAFPIILIISSFSFLAGMGGAPLASIAMGRGDNAKAERILGSACVFLLAMSVVLTVLCFWAMRPMLLMFGASEQTIGYAVDYFSLYLLGTPAVQLSLGLNYYISCQGFAKTSMMTVLIGAALNIILDPIFIYGLDMGCKGAALATICSQAVSAVWIFAFFFGKRTVLHFRRQYLRLDLKELVPVILLGLSPFFVQVTDCIVPLVMNAGMQQYGNDYVSTMTVMFSIEQLLRLPADGLCQGAVPIMSTTTARQTRTREEDLFPHPAFSFGFTTIASWLILLFPKTFIMPFTDSQRLIEITIPAIRICFGGVFIGVLYACQRTFMALGRTKLSLLGAMMRKLVILLPLCSSSPGRLWDGRPALCGMHRRRPGLRHCICDFHLNGNRCSKPPNA